MNSPQKALLRHRGYSGNAEVSIVDGCVHGQILHIDDTITYEGQTVPDLQSAFHGAVDRYLEHCQSVGKSPNRPYSGTLNVRIGPDRHRMLSEHAGNAGINLNEAICRAVDLLVIANSGHEISQSADAVGGRIVVLETRSAVGLPTPFTSYGIDRREGLGNGRSRKTD